MTQTQKTLEQIRQEGEQVRLSVIERLIDERVRLTLELDRINAALDVLGAPPTRVADTSTHMTSKIARVVPINELKQRAGEGIASEPRSGASRRAKGSLRGSRAQPSPVDVPS